MKLSVVVLAVLSNVAVVTVVSVEAELWYVAGLVVCLMHPSSIFKAEKYTIQYTCQNEEYF